MPRLATRLMLAGVSLTALFTAVGSGAQTVASLDTQTLTAANPDERQQDIIVTATKRAENLQKVPIAVQAIAGDQVRQLNITSLSDLTKLAPSLNFFENSTPRTQATFIRGIGTYTTSDAIEPSVGIVVDGVALGRQGMAFIDPFDVSQVEVLRGPQGTLFGKNASAGLINIATQAPSDTLHLAARGLYGNRNEQQYGVSLTGPLAEGLTGRVTAYYNRRDGDITNVFLNRTVNGLKNYGFRAKLRYEQGASDFTLAADFNRADANCCAWIAASDGGATVYHSLLAANGLTAGERNYSVAANILPVSRSTSGGLALTAHSALGGEELTSITAVRYWGTQEVADVDQLPISVLNSSNRTHQFQFSEEVRLSNAASSRWAHTIGLYYFHYNIDGRANLDFPASGGAFGPLGTVAAEGRTTLTYDNGAVFGELVYRFADERTKLRVGGRLTVESLGTRAARTDTIAFVPGFQAYDLSDANINTGFSGVVALQHQFTPDTMAYLQVSRGFKGAAYDLPGATDSAPASLAPRRVAPENAMNYEAGIRTQLFDRTLTFNGTLFYETFTNYQATTYDAAANAFRLQNVGSLLSRGVEVEFNWHPGRAFTLGGGVTFADARYDSFKSGQCQYTFFTRGLCTPVGPGAYVIDLSGRRLFAAPRWTYVVNARYDWRALSDRLTPYISANYAYRTSTVAEPSLDPVNFLQGYGLLDARLGIVSTDRRYELAVYGRNLTDQNYFQAHFFAPLFGGRAAGNNATAAFQGLRRSYGLELSVRF